MLRYLWQHHSRQRSSQPRGITVSRYLPTSHGGCRRCHSVKLVIVVVINPAEVYLSLATVILLWSKQIVCQCHPFRCFVPNALVIVRRFPRNQIPITMKLKLKNSTNPNRSSLSLSIPISIHEASHQNKAYGCAGCSCNYVLVPSTARALAFFLLPSSDIHQ